MKNFIIVSSGLAGILLMGPLVKEAAAGPLTGTWAGTATCAGVVQGVSKSADDVGDVDLTIAISQNGKALTLDITLDTSALNSDLNSGPHRYQGKTKGKGSAGKITQCGTTFGPGGSFNGVIGDVKAVTKKKTPGPLLTGDLLALDEPDNSAVVCVFDGVARTDASDPGVGPCP